MKNKAGIGHSKACLQHYKNITIRQMLSPRKTMPVVIQFMSSDSVARKRQLYYEWWTHKKIPRKELRKSNICDNSNDKIVRKRRTFKNNMENNRHNPSDTVVKKIVWKQWTYKRLIYQERATGKMSVKSSQCTLVVFFWLWVRLNHVTISLNTDKTLFKDFLVAMAVLYLATRQSLSVSWTTLTSRIL